MIITSRITLIDKATVPEGSTVVRLLEFDKRQRDCWSDVWNKANVNYFRECKIQEFILPDDRESGSDKILSLAEQPLLLLMLALYDSQDNQLRKSRGLDRTKLYDSLLKRFVMRERGKEKGFEENKPKERKRALNTEMQRLGVAALGMYNRRKVHIISTELDADLAFFNLEREVPARQGRSLSQADLLLGSFFFVHKSQARHQVSARTAAEEVREGTKESSADETSAFEFLHNTFGEFLTADFVLRRAASQVQALLASEANDALKPTLKKMLENSRRLRKGLVRRPRLYPLFHTPCHYGHDS